MDEDEQVSSDIFDQEEVQPYEPARSFELPQVQFYSIEYPGYVSQNPESLAAAIRSLGGQEAIDNVFRQPRAKLLELRLRPDEPLAHPIPGEVVNTSKILVEVVRRKKRRKAKLPNPASGSNQDSSNLMDIDDPSHSSLDPQTATPDTLPIQEAPWEDNGKFVIKPLGTIAKTIRFRALSDYQFSPDTTDPIIKFREAMSRLDPNEMVETVRSFKFAKELEDYSIPVAGTTTSNSTDITSDESIPQMQSNLRLPPPPIFLRSTLPLHY
ncbi:tau 95 subunit of transcription factor TFIIIC, partial [Tulasnella sp. 419]